MTILQPISASASPEVPANENTETLSAAGIFGKRHPASAGLIWGFYGGLYGGNTRADGTVTQTDNATNYIVLLRSTAVVSVSTSSTNSLDPLYAKLYMNTVAGGVVTASVDQRMDANGLLIGGASSGGGSGALTASGFTMATARLLGRTTAASGAIEEITVGTGLSLAAGALTATAGSGGIPVNSQSANYTMVIGDANGGIYHPPADTTARTWTIPADASLNFPNGTTITFDNDFGAGALTIACGDNLILVGSSGSTGSRTIAAGGQATAYKVSAGRWRINGTGLT